MTTLCHYTRTSLQVLNVAYAAITVLVLLMPYFFFATRGTEAWEAIFLPYITKARVLTPMSLSACFFRQFLTLFFLAYIVKGFKPLIASIAFF